LDVKSGWLGRHSPVSLLACPKQPTQVSHKEDIAPMDFFELIQKRYSVRAYKPDPVEDDKLLQILEAGRLARPQPTGSHFN
jgi:hypothetical protein